MAGPKIMSLGFYQFEALGFSFTGRQRELDTTWVSVPVAGGFDRLQWTGGTGKSETIDGVIFDQFGGQQSLEGIKQAATDGTPMPLISLAGAPNNVFGLWVVERVSEAHEFITPEGRPLKNTYTISLKGYEGDFSASDNIGPLLRSFF